MLRTGLSTRTWSSTAAAKLSVRKPLNHKHCNTKSSQLCRLTTRFLLKIVQPNRCEISAVNSCYFLFGNKISYQGVSGDVNTRPDAAPVRVDEEWVQQVRPERETTERLPAPPAQQRVHQTLESATEKSHKCSAGHMCAAAIFWRWGAGERKLHQSTRCKAVLVFPRS